MCYSDYRISIQEDHVLVERAPNSKITLDGQLSMLKALSEACKESGFRKVIVSGQETAIELSVAEIYHLGEEIAKLRLKVAVVEVHDASTKDVEFLENVVSNRSEPLRFFNNLNDAKEWLGVS